MPSEWDHPNHSGYINSGNVHCDSLVRTNTIIKYRAQSMSRKSLSKMEIMKIRTNTVLGDENGLCNPLTEQIKKSERYM
jgi:hypothetical protein